MTIVVAADPPPPPSLRRDGEVFILGAGFSKAIGTRMPTLNELGLRISLPFRRTPSFRLLPPAAKAALKASRMPGGSLEAWLSHLATPAPFLDQSERLHNAAIAQELIRLIVAEIERSEAFTLGGQMPAWLGRLVSLWDRLGATIITFNYDTLVEMAVNAAQMPWTIRTLSDPKQGGAFSFHKMHGSINWWWIPSDRIGTTVQPAPLAGRWGDPRRSSSIPGMERFIVPPLAVKSDFYDLSVTRENWLTAREALQKASRVVLMGYSAPVTDLTVASLLSNYADPNLSCEVVNTSPDEIVGRLQGLGLKKATGLHADEPIREFTERYEDATSRKVAGSLVSLFNGMDISPDDPVVAGVSGLTHSLHLPITEIREGDGVTTFVATEAQPSDVVAAALKVREVRDAIEKAAHGERRLMLEVPGQPRHAVLHVAARAFSRKWLFVEA